MKSCWQEGCVFWTREIVDVRKAKTTSTRMQILGGGGVASFRRAPLCTDNHLPSTRPPEGVGRDLAKRIKARSPQRPKQTLFWIHVLKMLVKLNGQNLAMLAIRPQQRLSKSSACTWTASAGARGHLMDQRQAIESLNQFTRARAEAAEVFSWASRQEGSDVRFRSQGLGSRVCRDYRWLRVPSGRRICFEIDRVHSDQTAGNVLAQCWPNGPASYLLLILIDEIEYMHLPTPSSIQAQLMCPIRRV